MKRYMMSDIHGFLEAFEAALKKTDLSGKNQLILLGDYIDYGPDGRAVLEKVRALQEKYGSEKVIALMGNHENTGGLKVAVATVDEGYEGDLISVNLNLGEQVISALHENTQLDWIFTTKKKAVNGVWECRRWMMHCMICI